MTSSQKVEKYKQSPELVRGYITALNPRLSEKPYLNIVPVGNLDNFDEIEGLIFFVTPDVLSGLSLGPTMTARILMP